eukprot:CAMPEP_0173264896 /NCGR_PEP_ID=MMETSP1142-20121109/28238_1 /TAXON_ID=483371 /ORGANISM="non described non described, Strain CCMP2298" /LENGTH=383 /DNA_ID=CAMNT_0014200503 /DNA_START=30 /DNA_END=1181 /DNA_ORIENTATION=+
MFQVVQAVSNAPPLRGANLAATADLFQRGARFHKNQNQNQKASSALAEDAESWAMVKYGCIALTIFLLSGTAVFCLKDGFTIINAFYLAVFTATTVGFGDVAPASPATKVFSCVFVFVGLLGFAQVVEFLVDYAVHLRLKKQLQHVSDLFHPQESGEEEALLGGPGIPRTLCWLPEDIFWALLHCLGITFLNVLVGTLGFSLLVDDHGYTDSMYMSFMIVTTDVGYGDVTPSGPTAKLFACCYSVLGTMFFAKAVSTLTSAITDHRLQAKYYKTLSKSVLDWDTFMQAADYQQQKLSRSDFLLFRLDQMHLIPTELRHQILDQFDRMDKNKDGVLSMADLQQHQHACLVSVSFPCSPPRPTCSSTKTKPRGACAPRGGSTSPV